MRQILPAIGSFILIALILIGAFLLIYFVGFDRMPYRELIPGYFLDRLPIPFDIAAIGPVTFPIEVDNFLVFQEFKSLRPSFSLLEIRTFGVLAVILISAFLAGIPSFKKLYFLIAGAAWILILTLSNLNGLNFEGLSTNLPLIVAIAGSLVAPVFFHVSGKFDYYPVRYVVSLLFVGISAWVLIQGSTLEQADIFLAEHALIPVFCLSIAWVLWNGHSMISGIYILLTRASRNLEVKISIQLLILSIVYLLLIFNILLDLTGNPLSWLPSFDPLYLLIPVGVLGYFVIDVKGNTDLDLIAPPKVLKSLHLIGFALILWLVWKLKATGNQPGEELLKHLFTYSQLGISAFLIIYLYSNFLSIMNTGKNVERVLFKPFSLPYYHLRLGGLIAMLVITAYANGIVGAQVNAMSNHVLGDYYYATDQRLNASILYENSWFRYRNNPKAKNALAHLLFELKQPSLAKSHLEQSVYEAPQEDNFVLLAERFHQENKLFQAISLLENGLDIFKQSEAIRNNLALLYLKTNRSEEAIQLLLDAPNEQKVTKSNLLASQLKSGNFNTENADAVDLPSKINALAYQNALGNIPAKELVKNLREESLKSTSPLLKQAGLRNVYSVWTQESPESDLVLLDSLWQQPEMETYIMPLQETAVIRSLAADRIGEAVKNLNGLAFRNPGDAGYFLHLSAMILASELDFKKAGKELLAAKDKGFQAFQNYHWEILTLGGYYEEAEQLRLAYELKPRNWFESPDSEEAQYLFWIERLHESLPKILLEAWKGMEDERFKKDFGIRLLKSKSHDLSKSNIQELADFIQKVQGENTALSSFAKNPDFQDSESINSFLEWLGKPDELTGNPYHSPLIWSAQAIQSDALDRYEILNGATEFNRDPVLWMRKVQAARELGLSNYATDALGEMSKWIDEETLYQLQMRKF